MQELIKRIRGLNGLVQQDVNALDAANALEQQAARIADLETEQRDPVGYISRRGLQALERGNSPTIHARGDDKIKGNYDIPIFLGDRPSSWYRKKIAGLEAQNELLADALGALHERYVMAIGNEGQEALAARHALAQYERTAK